LASCPYFIRPRGIECLGTLLQGQQEMPMGESRAFGGFETFYVKRSSSSDFRDQGRSSAFQGDRARQIVWLAFR
jgi:hypothetical protein